jgi:hypothetical protein
LLTLGVGKHLILGLLGPKIMQESISCDPTLGFTRLLPLAARSGNIALTDFITRLTFLLYSELLITSVA